MIKGRGWRMWSHRIRPVPSSLPKARPSKTLSSPQVLLLSSAGRSGAHQHFQNRPFTFRPARALVALRTAVPPLPCHHFHLYLVSKTGFDSSVPEFAPDTPDCTGTAIQLLFLTSRTLGLSINVPSRSNRKIHLRDHIVSSATSEAYHINTENGAPPQISK